MEGTIGEVRMFAGDFAPKYWQYCAGAMMAINQNQALFSILGTVFGGNGTTTFGLPDMRGRVAVGTGTGAGLTNRVLGTPGGTESTTMTVATMPAHTHAGTFTGTNPSGTVPASFKASTKAGEKETATAGASAIACANYTDAGFTLNSISDYVNDPAPSVNLTGIAISEAASTGAGTIVNSAAGSSAPFSNMMPSIGISYIICLQGIYPSRN